jgi:cytochrome-b5 reductase
MKSSTKCVLSIALTVAGGYVGYQCYNNCCCRKPSIALSPDEWRSFPLKEAERITHNTSRFRFALPAEHPEMGLTVSSCIVTRAPGIKGPDAKDVIRPYTPVNKSTETGFIDLVIKKYDKGPMSSFIFGMNPGDKLEIKGPIEKLKYEPNKYSHIGMVAGGTGITPMYQVLKAIASNPQDKTQVDVIFGNIVENDIILQKELDELQKTHSNIRVHYTVDKPSATWSGLSGYIDKAKLTKHFPAPKSCNFVYVCGPQGLYDSVSGPKAEDYSQGPLSGILKELGYKSEQVFKF